MIVGVGTDIVYIPRIEELYQKYPRRLLEKILTSEERALIVNYSNNRICRYLAKRFAAKEALVKAIGTGFRNQITLRDISIFNDDKGRPYYVISDALTNYINQICDGKNFSLHLSISDEYPIASAFTILEIR